MNTTSLSSPSPAPVSFGDHLRVWRQRRRLSQLDLATEAEISTRHLSFVETGRAKPSREMVLALAHQLEVPLRETNVMLAAAGFAPSFSERALDDPQLTAARQAVDLVLKGHEPYPALAVDRRWNLVAMNAAVAPLLDGIAPALLTPPVNVLRLSLHPEGLAPRILNLQEWRAHIFMRLSQQIDATADAGLVDLLEELRNYPAPRRQPPRIADGPVIATPLRLSSPAGELSFISTTTVFGTPLEVTLSELAIEAFFPADAQTAQALANVAQSATQP
ncbi:MULTISPECIES: helix-turn-helix transcriptional regulator [unclassified Beijerinckia]|uniref:helix-turn-helix domain-containing protein n=1 Tax=unclassified Beijerinckia TaxID=2638183 RepID=UPI0008949556|nr:MULTISPECIES: helix-turn-helix transcriptional regulator [unclassified Beijerinckia]MDH7795534.1 transcriptional regulator with XRE-family HTH domain [Beijerinckia sp. GAS462]SEC05549.1 transcriptional regulator, XRE family [Beijerinckia sp. 28-YEA-48]